ncbi:prepilin-type N-terminal cleavage/methylation domain-containing protein [Acaryochloris sp. 'Moss Beach']|uniref:PulJ/GspJ family protein n=1 Tax=Acaryochloris sp. 'Moss Beach' TaxID=2740837 RepID=UPI001F3A8BEF|nr:prepilin-type N-terminal cleavage/methylation domain-containing protein [Acaryochloris sp. 'Moss Beach']UJB69332.1 prepilin-type N-terminal cleavage/methylation domain-containing protein [Acaryochloris sp. 'Moss Beach']
MHKTLTPPVRLVLLLPRTTFPDRGRSNGFTLPELLVASLILSLVITLAGLGLIQLLRANERNTVEAERQSELNRALDFIVNDIKTATSVSVSDIPSRPNYLGVFKLTKVEGEGATRQEFEFAYYTAPKSASAIWRGPRTVYRQQIAPALAGPSTYALVDAISSVDPTCTGSGNSPSTSKGLKVFIQDNSYVKLCLVGQLNDSRTLLLETQAFTRGS